jgi:hypothetical protein
MLTILAKMAKILPSRCFPTMITPIHDDKTIDFARVKILTEWYIQVGLSSLDSGLLCILGLVQKSCSDSWWCRLDAQACLPTA